MDNHWLASLNAQDRKRIAPHLNDAGFTRGQTLYDAGEAVGEIWFPFSGVVSLMTLIDGDRMVETAAIGREGLVGVTCGPMNARAISRAIAQTDGEAVCLPVEKFSEVLADSDSAREALARYTEALFAQVQQTAACNARHRLEERLARWLLMFHDRADGNSFELTQAGIADMLGVRRATVSEVSAELERKGLIRRRRGCIQVLDREGLQAAACGCYDTIREVMGDLHVEATPGEAGRA